MATLDTAALADDDLLSSIDGALPPVRVSSLYKIGLLLVALAMVLLPLVYVGLIGLVAYGLVAHVANASDVMAAMGARRGAFLILVAPLIVGVILILFMIKPLFARQVASAKGLRLDPAVERRLFAFVERICDVVGAPAPREIRVDCEVNASASFRRGLFSFFGDDLVLTIGLPLVAGMTVRQLGGVLAHEFGHFAQGGAMRLTFVIRSVNVWFWRVVHERDSWDEYLARYSRRGDIRLMIILGIARAFVWLTRRILWALMMAGHAISCFMMRQMEYDADRYEARFAGSDTFESTAIRLRHLALAANQAHEILRQSWADGRLADDVPGLIVDRASRITPELKRTIQEQIDGGVTGVLDTHPADRDRIASARSERASGIYRLNRPAGELFADLAAISKRVTRQFYVAVAGIPLDAARLVPTKEIIRVSDGLEAGHAGLDEYLPGAVNLLHPLWLPPALDGAGDTPATAGALRSAHEAVRRRLPEVRAALAESSGSDRHVIVAEQAVALLEAGAPVDAATFRLAEPTRAGAGEASRAARAARQSVLPVIEEFHDRARERLVLALRLRRGDAADAASIEVAAAVRGLDALRRGHPGFLAVREALERLLVLLRNLEGREDDRRYVGTLKAAACEVETALAGLRDPMTEPDPYADRSEVTIGRRIVGESIAGSDELAELYHQGCSAVQRYRSLYLRTLGDLVLVAREVERAHGLDPMPHPPDGADVASASVEA